MSSEKSLILNAQQVRQKLLRMAQELYEVHYGAPEIVLIGIDKMGWELAQELHKSFVQVSSIPAQLCKITFGQCLVRLFPHKNSIWHYKHKSFS